MEGFYHSVQQRERKKEGAKVKFNVRISMRIYGWLDEVKVLIIGNTAQEVHLEYMKQDDEFAYFEKEIFLKIRAIYRYKFSFMSEWTKWYETEFSKLSVNFYVPDWAKGATMYHIMPDRFCRDYSLPIEEFGKRKIHKVWNEAPLVGPDENGEWARDSYGGNFRGIKSKLDYLKKLKIDIVYFSPIFTASSNHKYDADDYEMLDPYFGDEADFKSLFEAIHRRHMKGIVDVAFNHAGKDSKYYNKSGMYEELGAYQGSNSRYFPFFKTRIENGKIIFDYWWNIPDEVVFDKDSKEFQEYICGVGGIIDWLFSLGIDGIRIDVADDLTDYFINLMADACRRNKPDFLMIIEVWKNPFRMNRSYISDGKSAHSTMNYYLMAPVMDYLNLQDEVYLQEKINEEFEEYPNDTIFTEMNFTSTHDMSRQVNLFANEGYFSEQGDEQREWPWNLKDEYGRQWQSTYILPKDVYKKAKEMLKLHDFILTFWPGIFSIFYGDEVGVQGYGNLANRKSFPWKRIDKDILSHKRKMLKIRREYKFLRTAATNVLELTKDKFVFERINANEKDDQVDYKKIIVVVNNGYTELPLEYKNKEGRIIASYNYNSTRNVICSKGAVAILIY